MKAQNIKVTEKKETEECNIEIRSFEKINAGVYICQCPEKLGQHSYNVSMKSKKMF